MAALQFVDTPGYSAILFRKTYADLSLPGALMDRAREWITTKAHWDGQTYTFPSGATLTFGYLSTEQDKYRYQSAEFQSIGFDELTQFTQTQYRFLFSRLRRLEGVFIPLRMRGASNPGNIGHDWVKQRFLVEGERYGRAFIPAKLADNPYLDRAKYIESLMELDPITRRQYLNGDWTARFSGSIFKRENFTIVDDAPADMTRVRYWDKAATEVKRGVDADYTVGLLLGVKDGIYYILDIRRTRSAPSDVEKLVRQTAELDTPRTPIFMEQEPGSSGVDVISYYSRVVLQGFEFRPVRTTGSKAERAGPVSSAVEAGNVKLVRGTWVNAFLDEVEGFPEGSHDDQVDALSGAFEQLRRRGPVYGRRGKTV